jgi:hypothetical protein
MRKRKSCVFPAPPLKFRTVCPIEEPAEGVSRWFEAGRFEAAPELVVIHNYTDASGADDLPE